MAVEAKVVAAKVVAAGEKAVERGRWRGLGRSRR